MISLLVCLSILIVFAFFFILNNLCTLYIITNPPLSSLIYTVNANNTTPTNRQKHCHYCKIIITSFFIEDKHHILPLVQSTSKKQKTSDILFLIIHIITKKNTKHIATDLSLLCSPSIYYCYASLFSVTML